MSSKANKPQEPKHEPKGKVFIGRKQKDGKGFACAIDTGQLETTLTLITTDTEGNETVIEKTFPRLHQKKAKKP